MADGSKERSRGLAVYSWVLYDFAKTIFSISIFCRASRRGAGYVGTILALVVLTFFVSEAETVRSVLGPLGGWVETGEEPNSNAFVPTAVLYLLFSLPTFFFVPDPVALGAAYLNVISTVRVPDVRPETTVEEYAPLMQGERAL